MRAFTKALVGATAAVGIAAGGLATAGTAMATPAAAQQSVSARTAAVLATNNLGLDTAHAKSWQCWLRTTGYNPGTIDGKLGTDSWKAAQRKFDAMGYYDDPIDGIVGPNTIRALQRYLNLHGADLDVDGIAGPQTRSEFWDFAGTHRC
ncbi:peptidoglycan-binding domain-containing protein [Streptomyces sp. PU10]|uniref:peptidoglycan-binding domain-containing protein n=1 Tax=Streptomyces TaxID=1883 RepID=UPI00159096D0|nr:MULTISPECIES: peptidoglycan-binding domain-containing protein [Streptomyces]MDU0255780.1 peptidoglycan-binding domain-containing protein [Streptomyces sp. PU10]QKW61548.1 peptidoglycan-binding protein [Streptomyces sp. NA03103]WSU01765.1 peptidoglycan-binding protein [Streptomyces sp. NBC_01124]